MDYLPVATIATDPAALDKVHPSRTSRLRASLRIGGQVAPPLLIDDDGRLICGLARLAAIRTEGFILAPCVRASSISIPPNQYTYYRLLDHALSSRPLVSPDILEIEAAALNGAHIDPYWLGTGAMEDLKQCPAAAQITWTDSGAAVQHELGRTVHEQTRPGDIWLLGQHRLMCGDTGRQSDVMRLMDGAEVHTVHTDPPYNTSTRPRSRLAISERVARAKSRRTDWKPRATSAMSRRTKDFGLVNDALPAAEYRKRFQTWLEHIAQILRPGRAFYIWGGYANLSNYILAIKETDLHFSQCVVWVKSPPVITFCDFMGGFELCFYGWRKGDRHVFLGANNVSDVWKVPTVPRQDMIHLTEKPVLLALRAITCSSREGENVADLFGGSGSTLIACEQTGRRCYMMEIVPAYCDLIVDRWERYTGQTATLCRAETTTCAR